MGKMLRRLLDFKSMDLDSESDVDDKDSPTLGSPITPYVQKRIKLLEPYFQVMKTSDDIYGQFNYFNPQNYLILSVSAFTGFLTGSFGVEKSINCRESIMILSEYISKSVTAILNVDEERIVYYSTRVLKYVHPSLYYCYYAGKDTYETGYTIVTETSY